MRNKRRLTHWGRVKLKQKWWSYSCFILANIFTFDCIVPFLALAGIILLGLTYLTLPSLEKRFSLSGKEMGIIVASSDISALLVLVFISFYGDYGNKIRWIGGGGLIVGMPIRLQLQNQTRPMYSKNKRRLS